MSSVAAGAGSRWTALDRLRGLAVLGMLLVNNPGSWAHSYPALQHARWNGLLGADLVFPFFLFAAGASIACMLRKQEDPAKQRSHPVRRALLRSLLLFGIGLLLNAIPDFEFGTLRFMGVLQRIAIVTLLTTFAGQSFMWRGNLLLALALCLLHSLLLSFVPVPGYGPPNLSPEHSLSAWLDRQILGTHLWLWSKSYDPEGVLSSITALATALCGLATAQLYRVRQSLVDPGLLGIGLTATGLLWTCWLPLNKSLWTASFALCTAGCAALLLLPLTANGSGVSLLSAAGRNALSLFLLSSLAERLLSRFPGPGAASLQAQSYKALQAMLSALDGRWDPRLSSLIWAICFILPFALGAIFLQRRGLYLRL
ncbi:MAG: heparan-alpha-glucosaminide N-acetyltransferase domain-containing protein [Leptospirales bacterium]|nr:heparan-alpha-glucosaminide N-acetyltransferase domain-containing protein [Leptospirales bacterium]